ncbi:hypothetical protein B0H12DRAFT_143301 [Mycena haematopus]|nr:hypothetical protein B0H12DRAFT_143301 [Mycena haematopus]
MDLTTIDDSSQAKIPIQKIDAFCTEYHLSKEICTFLDENGFPTVNALLDIKGSDLEKFGKAGQRAELRWALKKMILEKLPGARPTTAEGEYTPTIHGGHGGTGGHGRKKGGAGGTGKGAHIRIRRGDVCQVGVISGGTGGHGGAAGGIVENAEVAKRQVTLTGGTPQGPDLYGGKGVDGGPHKIKGETGGVGEGPKVSWSNVSLFRTIVGKLVAWVVKAAHQKTKAELAEPVTPQNLEASLFISTTILDFGCHTCYWRISSIPTQDYTMLLAGRPSLCSSMRTDSRRWGVFSRHPLLISPSRPSSREI